MGKIIGYFFVSADGVEYPDYWIHLLAENKVPQYFPRPALTFLDRIVADDKRWSSAELGTCLTMMVTTNPDLEDDSRYARLRDLIRQRVIGY